MHFFKSKLPRFSSIAKNNALSLDIILEYCLNFFIFFSFSLTLMIILDLGPVCGFKEAIKPLFPRASAASPSTVTSPSMPWL